jgi:preprotein translocase subunit YajC
MGKLAVVVVVVLIIVIISLSLVRQQKTQVDNTNQQIETILGGEF